MLGNFDLFFTHFMVQVLNFKVLYIIYTDDFQKEQKNPYKFLKIFKFVENYRIFIKI